MKSREERRRLVLPARMRSGSGWNDACILNISSRGLMIYSKCAVEPGKNVELYRGGCLVTARVVWRNNHRMGLRSPERSRDRSRAIEFMSLVLVGTVFAGGVAVHAQQALTKPLEAVQTALRSH